MKIIIFLALILGLILFALGLGLILYRLDDEVDYIEIDIIDDEDDEV